jgi:NAD(P)-dependent dehydrogenase (short-subunit alcohol dehydrogenase family)
LGSALVDAFVARGLVVHALVRRQEDAEEIRRRQPERCFPFTSDVVAESLQDDVRAHLEKDGDRLSFVINSAGLGGTSANLTDVDVEEVLRLFRVHCIGVLRVTRACLPFLGSGSIVANVSSRLGSLRLAEERRFAHLETSYSYRIAKASQNMLTLCMAQELGERGVSVCAVHPGRLQTASGAADANMDPSAAAQRLATWLLGAAPHHSRFYSLEGDHQLPW